MFLKLKGILLIWMPRQHRILLLSGRLVGYYSPFGSRQKKWVAGRTEILEPLIESEVSAFLLIDEEDEMVRVPHAHQA